MPETKVKIAKPCLKCSAKPSPDSDPDYPLCEAHMVRCSKCYKGISPDSDEFCEIHLTENQRQEKDCEDANAGILAEEGE